jgi:hypothetical protein
MAPPGTTAGPIVRHRQAEPHDVSLERHSREAKVIEDGLDAMAGGHHAAQEGIDRKGDGGSEREQPTSPDDRGPIRLGLSLPLDRHHPLRQCNRRRP